MLCKITTSLTFEPATYHHARMCSGNLSSRFSENSEANASEFKLKEMSQCS